MPVGAFSGLPKTEWLNQPVDDARDMKLLEAFSYTDSAGKLWDAPAGSVINGASIPASLWTLVGSPYTGCYRNASIVHDVACVRARTKAERKAADRMFYEACLAGGCQPDQANDLYIGVRIGARWSPPAAGLARAALATGPARKPADALKAFRAVRKQLGDRRAAATPAEIDRLVSAELEKTEAAAAKPARKAARKSNR